MVPFARIWWRRTWGDAMKLKRFRIGHVEAGGEIRQRMERTAEKMLHGIDVEAVFVRHFRERREVPEVPGGFAGYGMFLDALVKAAAHGVGGEALCAEKRHRVAELIATQTEDGAITMFAGEPGFWDNHEQAYFIQALVLDAEVFGESASLEAAVRLGDFLIRRGTGMQLGLETAFLRLYEATGAERFLAVCREAFRMESDMETYDRALTVNGVQHVYTWIARALSQLQYSALTGRREPVLFAGTEELFRRVFGGYASITGTCSGGFHWGEVWDDTQTGLGKWGETCVSAYLLRCTAEWMQVNPDSRYGDVFERVLYNAFFGAQSADGSKQRYFSPFNEPGEWYENETYCCPNNLRRMMFELPEAMYFQTEEGVAVNLYGASTLVVDDLRIVQETDYPEGETVRLKVEAGHAFTLALRIPRWCKEATLEEAGGPPRSVAPGWTTVALSAGETTLVLHLPASVRWVRGMAAQQHRVALMRGPLVYALNATRNGLSGHQVDVLMLRGVHGVEGALVRVDAVIDNQNHPELSLEWTRFSDENRTRTYFRLEGADEGAPVVDDELFAGVGMG